jgi:hypothetical protein
MINAKITRNIAELFDLHWYDTETLFLFRSTTGPYCQLPKILLVNRGRFLFCLAVLQARILHLYFLQTPLFSICVSISRLLLLGYSHYLLLDRQG